MYTQVTEAWPNTIFTHYSYRHIIDLLNLTTQNPNNQGRGEREEAHKDQQRASGS